MRICCLLYCPILQKMTLLDYSGAHKSVLENYVELRFQNQLGEKVFP